MCSSNGKVDFKKFSEIVGADAIEHDKNIKQYCVKSSMVSLEEFYDGYKKEIKEINAEVTPSKDRPAIADFSDIFKAFDAYPTNLSKPKKHTAKEITRSNSIVQKNSALSDVSVAPKDSPSSVLNASKSASDTDLSATEILQDYTKFKTKLNQLLVELDKKTHAEEYAMKLKQLGVFAQELEKLLPSNGVETAAFTKDEEHKLDEIVKDMVKLGFLRKNQDLFRSLNGNAGNCMLRLDSLTEVLSYALVSISCFNII